MIGFDFKYNNKSLRDLGFMMAKPDEQDEFGLAREVLKGSITPYKNFPVHFGTNYNDSLILHFFIIKNIYEDKKNIKISNYELRKLQSWLTSPHLPLPLIVESYDHTSTEYMGIFTEVTPFETNALNGLYLTFTCNSQFAYQSKRTKIKCEGTSVKTIICDTDETNMLTSPTVTIIPNTPGEFRITNLRDGESMVLNLDSTYKEIIIDCKLKRIIGDGQNINFTDVGWSVDELLDFNNINSGVFKLYWLQLAPGVNKLQFNGNGIFYINYKTPIKVGGFNNVNI